MNSVQDARQHTTNGLRQLADFLDTHPAVPCPDLASAWLWTSLNDNPGEMRARFDATLAALKDPEVELVDERVKVTGHFGGVRLLLTFDAKDVLEKREVTRRDYVLPERERGDLIWMAPRGGDAA